MENNFCYWHEDIPNYTQSQFFTGIKKICLLRQMEYKLEKEFGINNKTNIFCPFQNADQAVEMDCIIGIKLNEKVSE